MSKLVENQNANSGEAPEFVYEVWIDYMGAMDYYSGHGHAFASKDLVACCAFGFPLFDGTIGEYKDAILEDLRSHCPEFFIDDRDEQDRIIDFLAQNEKEIVDSLFELADNEPALTPQELEDFGLDQWEEYFEVPYLVGYVHVYRIGDQ